MSAFTIYAFVVTGLYILYMAVVVLTDLFRKKDHKNDGVEEISNSDMGDEDGRCLVDESPDDPRGYRTHSDGDTPPATEPPAVSGDSTVDSSVNVAEDRSDDVPQQEQAVSDDPSDEGDLQEESLESQAAYERLKSITGKMDVVVPAYQEDLSSVDFAAMLAQPPVSASQDRILRKIINL